MPKPWSDYWWMECECEPLPPPVRCPVSTEWPSLVRPGSPARARHNKYQSLSCFLVRQAGCHVALARHHWHCTDVQVYTSSLASQPCQVDTRYPCCLLLPSPVLSTTKKTVHFKLSKTVNCNRIKQLKYNTHSNYEAKLLFFNHESLWSIQKKDRSQMRK